MGYGWSVSRSKLNRINWIKRQKAAIYADSGRIEQALKELNVAIEINPSHYASLVNLGVLKESQGKFDKALEFYDKALEANPVSVDSYRKRSAIYLKKKDWKKAPLFYQFQ